MSRESANLLTAGIVILGVILAALGIIQRATFNGKIYGFWELVQGGSPFGPFVNRNHFAGWMLMVIPLSLGHFFALVPRGRQGSHPGFRSTILWFATDQASRAILTGFAILVMCLSLVLTMSRSGMMSLAFAMVIGGIVMARHQPRTSRRGFALGYVLFVTLSVAAWVGFDQIVARFGDESTLTGGHRLEIWRGTVRIARDFWLTGTGFNTYGVSTTHYQFAPPGRHLREAHSDYLQLASEGGMLLGIPIVFAIIAFSVEVRRRLRDDVGSIWWIRIGAITGLMAVGVQSLGEFSLQMPANAAMFAVVAGLAIHDGRRPEGQIPVDPLISCSKQLV
jgi:O-antigen ligase